MNPPSSGVSPLDTLSALVVEPEETDRTFIVLTLSSAGLGVTAVDSFNLARSSLMTRPPGLLVTEIRLGTHNGLHLALLGRSMRPDMTVVVVSRHRDCVLERDARAMGAAFVEKPLTEERLLAGLRAAALYQPGANDACQATHPGANAAPSTAPGIDTLFDPPARRRRKTRRDIASFLLLEAARRRAR